MSTRKQIVEIESDGVRKEELFTFAPVRCPRCNGKGGFTEEIGRNTIKETPCPYCAGSGRVACAVLVWWRPYIGDESSIKNLKQFYDEVEKRGNY